MKFPNLCAVPAESDSEDLSVQFLVTTARRVLQTPYLSPIGTSGLEGSTILFGGSYRPS
jgi:hypothetical protein